MRVGKKSDETLNEKIYELFQKFYPGFCFFLTESDCAFLLNLCIDFVSDEQLLSNIQFCNDIFKIPPVKTFLLYNEETINKQFCTKGENKIVFTDKQKRGIGAFWGTVFKGLLNYSDSKNIAVSLSQFNVSTASYFSK